MAVLANIITDRLRIVPFEDRHLTERYVRWLNDPEVVRYSEQRYLRHTLKTCRAYFESVGTSDDFFCAIEETERGIGHIGNLTVITDIPNSVADIAIMIGEKKIWGTGAGFESWTAVMSALLEREGFRKVSGGTMAANRAMVRIMEKSGMAPDGRRTAQFLLDGDQVDLVYYAKFGAGRV